jgi:hypothetical protein
MRRRLARPPRVRFALAGIATALVEMLIHDLFKISRRAYRAVVKECRKLQSS